MNNQRASVIIPLYNDATSISACIEALLVQNANQQFEIIVVDDGSTDNSAELVANYPVRLFKQQNAGPAAARNVGGYNAKTDILIFLDADCIAAPNWLDSILKAFENLNTDVVTGAIVPATQHMMARLIQLEIEERYCKLANSSRVDFFASVAFAIRRERFIAVGGFREDFRYNEDVELAYRLNASGTQMVFLDTPRVAHFHPEGWKNYFMMKFWRGVWRMRLYRLFPQKAVSDSWTPQTLKLQTVSGLGVVMTTIATPFYPPAGWLVLILLAIISVSGAGFILTAWKKDGALTTFHSIPFLVVRAISLGFAVAWHFATFRYNH